MSFLTTKHSGNENRCQDVEVSPQPEIHLWEINEIIYVTNVVSEFEVYPKVLPIFLGPRPLFLSKIAQKFIRITFE